MAAAAKVEDLVRVACVRVSNFRALRNIEVPLDDLTVLLGANNCGKSSFLDALHMALGIGRRQLGQEDVFIEPGESMPAKDRAATVDVMIRPVSAGGTVADTFAVGSYWVAHWGTGIAQDDQFHDFMGFRATLAWDLVRGEYTITRKFLKEWPVFADWLNAEQMEEFVSAGHTEPVALHYIDAKRDLEEDIRRPGSFWRRLTDDLGLDETAIDQFEQELSKLNQSIIDKSDVLKHLKTNLGNLEHVVASDPAGIEIAPVARRLRDLSRGIDVTFSSGGGQAFPLTRHGMGTRSLASLLVFKAFVSWKTAQVLKQGEQLHPLLALEEPESHLHPQAQRALFAQIESIPGQRLVSTHSPYFAGQAKLENLRLFCKQGYESVVRKIDTSSLKPAERLQLDRMVVATRGDLLFSRAIVLFEGVETEDQALPVFAKNYWGHSVHQLGFSFVGIGGGHYFPFVWLAEKFGIRWYVLSDGEPLAVKALEAALKRAEIKDPLKQPNVVVIPGGHCFETAVMAEGYAAEAELALEVALGTGCVTKWMTDMHGKQKSKTVVRDYSGADGKTKAILDMLDNDKTTVALPLAQAIVEKADANRRTPAFVEALFTQISKDFSLKKAS